MNPQHTELVRGGGDIAPRKWEGKLTEPPRAIINVYPGNTLLSVFSQKRNGNAADSENSSWNFLPRINLRTPYHLVMGKCGGGGRGFHPPQLIYQRENQQDALTISKQSHSPRPFFEDEKPTKPVLNRFVSKAGYTTLRSPGCTRVWYFTWWSLLLPVLSTTRPAAALFGPCKDKQNQYAHKYFLWVRSRLKVKTIGTRFQVLRQGRGTQISIWAPKTMHDAVF